MELGIYAHPFGFGDLDGLGGPESLAALRIDEVAVAAAYHAGRWLVPGNRAAIVRFLEDGVVHATIGRDYSEIQPRASRMALAHSGLAASCAIAQRLGVRASAWTVLFHNTRLGMLHPGSCVQNAFGDRFEYALCPARPEVREYGLTLLRDLATTPHLSTIELEAAGWMGHKHGGHHDKPSVAIDAHADFLLSYCFCSSCLANLGELGIDANAARSRCAELLIARFHSGDALEEKERSRELLAGDLGTDVLEAMLETRRRGNESFLREARAVLPSSLGLALHVHPDPYFTGSQMGIELARLGPSVQEVVFTCYAEGADRIEALLKTLIVPPGLRTRLAIWPRAPQFRDDPDLRRVRDAAVAAGVGGVRIYHAGLLPARTLRRAAGALGTGMG